MSAPSTLHWDAYFVQRDDSTCARETKPTFGSIHLLGEVESANPTNDPADEVFQKWNPNTGRMEDHTVFPKQEVLNVTLTVKELSPVFWQLLMRAQFPISGGGGTFKFGSQSGSGSSAIRFPGEGWLRLVAKDERTVTIMQFDSYGYLQVTSHNSAAGIQTATFAFKKLYSSLHDSSSQGVWTNIR